MIIFTLWCWWSDSNARAVETRGGRRPDRQLWGLWLSGSVSPGFRRGLCRSSRSVDGWRTSRKEKKKNRQNLINGNLSAPTSRPFSVSLRSWFMRAGGGRSSGGKELWARSICCTTEDATPSWHHLGLACMWRKRSDRTLRRQMMAEPFGGAAGTGFLRDEWLDRWMKDQRMDGWTGQIINK